MLVVTRNQLSQVVSALHETRGIEILEWILASEKDNIGGALGGICSTMEEVQFQRGRLKIVTELETFIAELKDDSVNWIAYGLDVKEDDDA